MNLHTVIMQAQSFSVLKQISENGRADVSFSGIRYLEVPGYEGRAAIDVLGWKVTDIAINVLDYNEEEREIGMNISDDLMRLYTESEEQLKEKKLFTKICCFFRDFIQHCQELRRYGNNPRYDWSAYFPQPGHYVFRYYSKIQHERYIGPIPQNALNGHYPFNKPGSAIRWCRGLIN